MALTLVRSILQLFGILMLGAAVSIPVGYVIAPFWYAAHEIPHGIMTFVLELSWYMALLVVLCWFIDEWLPLIAVRSLRRERSLPQRLRDQAPFLQAVPIVEDAGEPPALSPPRKSLPAPARG